MLTYSNLSQSIKNSILVVLMTLGLSSAGVAQDTSNDDAASLILNAPSAESYSPRQNMNNVPTAVLQDQDSDNARTAIVQTALSSVDAQPTAVAPKRPGILQRCAAYAKECYDYGKRNLAEAAFRGASVAGLSAVIVVITNISEDISYEQLTGVLANISGSDPWLTMGALGITSGFVYGGASSLFQVGGKPYSDFISTAQATGAFEETTGLKLPVPIKAGIDSAEKIMRSYGVEATYLYLTATALTILQPDYQRSAMTSLMISAAYAVLEQGLMELTLAEQREGAILRNPEMKEALQNSYAKITSRYAIAATAALVAQVVGQERFREAEDFWMRQVFAIPLYAMMVGSAVNYLRFRFIQKRDIRDSMLALVYKVFPKLKTSLQPKVDTLLAPKSPTATPSSCMSSMIGWIE